MPDPIIPEIRDASRRLVRELGFMKATLAGTDLHPSAVHALIEVGASGSLTAAELSVRLNLDKSSISRMVQKLVASEALAEGASGRDGRAKPLSLAPKGRRTLAAIDAFADGQVGAALERLAPRDRGNVRAGLAAYAGALEALRTGTGVTAGDDIIVESGYRPGVVGRCAEMHIRYYARAAGFGQAFESKVASGLADFVGRLDRPVNGLWTAVKAGAVIGTVAIDGEDLGAGIAHLRWFIVDDGWRGAGIGGRLLEEAVAFSDRAGFAEIQLWTFSGLDAARRLYEASGFQLAGEWLGRQWGREVTEQRFVRRAGAV